MNDLLPRHLGNHLRRILVIQLCLGLPLEPGIRMLDGNYGRHAVAHIGAREIGVLLL